MSTDAAGYTVSLAWRPLDDGWVPKTADRRFPDLAAAETYGLQMGCLAGVTRVEVRNRCGDLEALWDKTSTEQTAATEPYYVDETTGEELYDVVVTGRLWQRLGAESAELGRRYATEARKEATTARLPQSSPRPEPQTRAQSPA